MKKQKTAEIEKLGMNSYMFVKKKPEKNSGYK